MKLQGEMHTHMMLMQVLENQVVLGTRIQMIEMRISQSTDPAMAEWLTKLIDRSKQALLGERKENDGTQQPAG